MVPPGASSCPARGAPLMAARDTVATSRTRVAASPVARAIAIALPVLPWVLVLAGAAERPLRIPALVVAVAGLAIAGARLGDRARAAWAAPVPVAALLVLALIPEPTALAASADCGALAPLRVVRRVVEMSAVLCVTALAWRVGRVPSQALRIRRPTRLVGLVSIAAFLAAAPIAVAFGPALAEPFFGPVALPAPGLVALVPLLVAALANATQEELAYRGAWLGWGGIAAGPVLATTVQALAFGLAHTGADFSGPQLPVVAAMAAGGVLAALLARRTGSLTLPIALHAAADVPMALYAVCGGA
jgi:membrane protease YdiL (CAAX protease family)